MLQKILVTGGCGFIGSHFIRSVLTDPDVSVLNIDVLTYAGNTDNLKDVVEGKGDRYEHAVVDVCDGVSVEKIIKNYKPNVVIHFAAESHVDRSYFDVSDFIRTNIEGTRVLIDALRKFSSNTRFVHISTDEVYGDIECGNFSSETSLIKPSNLYAASKAGADMLVQSAVRTYGFPAVIVRGSNNYGTHQYPEKLIPMTITNLLSGADVSLHGDGSHERSWLNVRDFCSAIILVMNKAELGTVWNVSGEIKTNRMVIDAVANVLGVDVKTKIKSVPDRPGADFRYAPDSGKIRNELGWCPEYTFDQSIRTVVEWYLQNEWWWKKLHGDEVYKKHNEKQSSGDWF